MKTKIRYESLGKKGFGMRMERIRESFGEHSSIFNI